MMDQKLPEVNNEEVARLVESTTTSAQPEIPVVRMQHVIITLADGRRGVFMGPELIKEVEMKLGMVPKLVSIDFDPPRAVAVPVAREEVSGDQKEKPAENTAGLE